MATAKQELGALGERLVVQNCACPRCKQSRTLVPLRANFKCADVICDFCGYLAQVKASTSGDGRTPPRLLLGAAWGPQKQRMDAGIYFPLFLVLVAPVLGRFSIHYLSADLQTPELFLPRTPLSETARRAGWQGFITTWLRFVTGLSWSRKAGSPSGGRAARRSLKLRNRPYREASSRHSGSGLAGSSTWTSTSRVSPWQSWQKA